MDRMFRRSSWGQYCNAGSGNRGRVQHNAGLAPTGLKTVARSAPPERVALPLQLSDAAGYMIVHRLCIRLCIWLCIWLRIWLRISIHSHVARLCTGGSSGGNYREGAPQHDHRQTHAPTKSTVEGGDPVHTVAHKLVLAATGAATASRVDKAVSTAGGGLAGGARGGPKASAGVAAAVVKLDKAVVAHRGSVHCTCH